MEKSKNLNNPFNNLCDCVGRQFDSGNIQKIYKRVVKPIPIAGTEDYELKEDIILVDTVDLQAQMNEQAKDVSIYGIMEKFALTGDESLFGKVGDPFYTDLSSLPKDDIDLAKFIKKAKAEYDKLDPDIKNQYSFDAFANLNDGEIANLFKKDSVGNSGGDSADKKVNVGSEEKK